LTDNQKSYSLYRDLSAPVIMCHHSNEDPFISIPHLHSQYEIYYNVSGGKSFFVNNHFYPCEPHALFVIPHTHIHKVVAEKNAPYERCVLNIDANIVHSIASLPNMKQSALHWLTQAGQEHSHKIVLDSYAHHVFLNMVDTYIKQESIFSEIKLLAYLLQIFDFLEEQFAKQRNHPLPTMEPTALSDKVIRYIEQNQGKPLNIKDIANALYIHENYLCTKFKSETDMTINNYIILRKIAEAKKLLYNGCTVKEACFQAGFQNYSNFIRTFKNKEGYPPSQLTNLTTPL